jgi:uncharacterized protein DUF2784
LIYRALADFVLVVHLAFVLFVVFGGLLVLRWPRVAFVHIPAAIWGVLIEYSGWICPLTPLENAFRRAGGDAGYSGGFVEHYILPGLYPAGLTRETQIVLGSLALLVNLTAYGVVIARRRRVTGRKDRE